MKFIHLGLFLAVFAFFSCKKEEPAPKPVDPGTNNPAPVGGSVTLEFMNRLGGEELALNKGYLLLTGDSLTVTKFDYYISNVVLIKEGGNFVQPESYFVVRHPDKRKLAVSSVPSGTYTGVRFLVGVDSLRNCSGAQTDGLDLGTNGDMFWSWNTGYIFMKLEGRSPQSGASGKTLTYHIGGFKGENKAQRQVQISFGSTPLIINNNAATVKLGAEVNKFFKSASEIDPATLYNMMSPGENAKKIANNYATMFSLESVQN